MTAPTLKVQGSSQVTGRSALMNRKTLVAIGMKEGRTRATVVLRQTAPDVAVTLVTRVSDLPQDGIVFVPTEVRARFAPSALPGQFSVAAVLASPGQRLRLMVTAARVSPILAIAAAIVTALAVFTGNAAAPGLNAFKIVAAAFVLLSAVCTGWVGFRSA